MDSLGGDYTFSGRDELRNREDGNSVFGVLNE